ncbi:MAG TPA: tRNA lysidine(34) synthetase TilS, partial [Gammaproteobacteria bacterium]|nr:tRNA lysidine(34) synthetase TilS [Gammaproteobacteria bacterium]
LSAQAGVWQDHCQTVCDHLAVPLQIIQVNAQPVPGQSPEETARVARYRALASVMQDGACLLTAHHRRDQAETLMLQLLRGGGVQGTAAMPPVSGFAEDEHVNCMHLRPLLDCGHEQLQDYATAHQLDWIEDDSNTNTRYDRNYLRHQIMPELRQRWPAVDATLARVARRHAETAGLLNDLAATDLASVQAGSVDCLDRAALSTLPDARQRNLIRYWLVEQRLTVPGHARLDEVLRQIHQAGADTMPCISWSGGEIRRYRDGVYAMAPQSSLAGWQAEQWPDQDRVLCPGQQGYIERHSGQNNGIRASIWQHADISVRYRSGGESFRPAGHAHHRSLKNLFQEWGVPPWQRSRIPLLYVDEELAAVIGYSIGASYVAGADEPGYVLQWQYSD